MRPLRLTLKAFKPFPGEHVIDFEALAAKGVFLVLGNTGTGKSSIFDAMTWALYGMLPSKGRRNSEVQSGHAAPTEQTVVELEFSAQGGRYRVKRQEDYQSAKKGGGFTTKGADAVLVKLTPTGTQVVASGRDPVTKACTSLVGLDIHQFEKVVLLPQGEFERFLISTETDRRLLLRQLFDGHLYDQAILALKQGADAAADALTTARGDVDRLRTAAVVRLGAAVQQQGLGMEIPEDLPRERFSEISGALDAVLAERKALRDASESGATSAENKARDASIDAGLFDRAKELKDQKRVLLARRSSIEAGRRKAEGSARGRPVMVAKENLDRSRQAMAKVGREVKRLGRSVEVERARLISKESAREGAQKKTKDLPELQRRLAAWGALESALLAVRSARAAVTAADRAFEEVLEAHLSSQASRLAATLEAGVPCPVCGSVSHPRPAKSARAARGSRPVDEAALSGARKKAEDARGASARAEAEVSRQMGVLGLDPKRAVGDTSRRKAAAARLLDTALAAQERVQSLTGDVREIEARLKEVSGAAESGRDRFRELKGAVGIQERQLAEVLGASKFPDVARALRVVLAPAIEGQLKSAADTFDREWAAVVSDLEGLKAGGRPVPRVRPDAEGLKAEAARLRSLATDARDRWKSLKDALKDASKIMESVWQLEGDLSHTEDAARRATKVFQVCRGENGLGVSLESWILSAELDRVLALANVHLFKMSKARYRLERLRDEGKVGSLEIAVFDSDIGKLREVVEFSGGEKFFASLSLALGLADVVSHGGAGSGVTFEALFIDEGFDALSEDYLELVTDVLGGLQAEGRMVGAITHIQGMRDRLHAGIEVTKIFEGGPSTLKVNV